MHYGGIEQRIISLLEKSIGGLSAEPGPGPLIPPHEIKPELEIPKEEANGDLSTNVAMKLARHAKMEPMAFASAVKELLEKDIAASGLSYTVAKVEVKQPGFINFFLHRKYLAKVLLEIKRKKTDYGRSSICRGMKAQVEFVSANPTGPLTIAHGRQAAIGDSLANIMECLGCKVVREYYLNDEGTQMDILAASIRARYLELLGRKVEFPVDGYKGSYIIDIAKYFRKRYGRKYARTENNAVFMEYGLKWILSDIKKDLKDFGVKFDVWYSQKLLRKSGKIAKAIRLLREKGYIYEKDNAVWFKSTEFGDDKDRVVFKSDGSATYLAPDIAYHIDKYMRGFRKLIDIWGPDHHGYVPRLKAAMKALGYSDDSLSILIVQLATLFRGGQEVSMSTRAGEFITLREVMDEVGKDVARFSFLMRRLSSHLDFDLEAVKKESMDNPVFYIQYAHARIWSVLGYSRKVKASVKFNSNLLKEEEELRLLRALRRFPFVVITSATTMEPYVILQYLQDLATLFHTFYTKHRIVSDDISLTRARLVLVDCVRIVLANGLRLLGVSLPKKM